MNLDIILKELNSPNPYLEVIIDQLPKKACIEFAFLYLKEIEHLIIDKRSVAALAAVEEWLKSGKEVEKEVAEAALAAATCKAIAANAAAHAVSAISYASYAYAAHAYYAAVDITRTYSNKEEAKQKQLSILKDIVLRNISKEEDSWLLRASL